MRSRYTTFQNSRRVAAPAVSVAPFLLCVLLVQLANFSADGFVPSKLVGGSCSSARRPAFVVNKPSPLPRGVAGRVAASSTPLFSLQQHDDGNEKKKSLCRRIWNRFDTVRSVGLAPDQVRLSGLSAGGGKKKTIIQRIKSIHNPITYLLLALVAGFRWDWCFRNPYYWFGVGFCIKWYRARYVFKIPVWDRQPNWNNIITSKEQEKDLKAFTCKNCGSTLFIAKTREFFFEGSTGIGGLGCFSCGAKGKDNFVEDRERIVEDVADMDDYFEYERPLDFVTRAERRKLLKEAKGDEDLANKLLIEQQGEAVESAEASFAAPSTDEAAADAVDATPVEEVEEEKAQQDGSSPPKEDSEDTAAAEPSQKAEEPEAPPAPSAPESEKKQSPPPPPPAPPANSDSGDDDDILDLLDMDG